MFHKKTPKREEQNDSMLTFHLRSSFPREQWSKGYINVVSIDPGIANFGFRIETRTKDGKVHTVVLVRKCFSKEIVEDGFYSSLYTDVIRWLEQYREYFMLSHVFIIERQLPINYQSVRLSQHVLTYFMLLLVHSSLEPLLVEIDANAKYTCLGAPKQFNATALKQWGTTYALELLQQRGDQAAIEVILGTKGVRGLKKQDDLCDTVLQVEAFLTLHNITIM